MKVTFPNILRVFIIRLSIIALCIGLSFSLLHSTSWSLTQSHASINHYSHYSLVHLNSSVHSFDPIKSELHYSNDAKFVTPISWRYLSLLQFSSEHFPAEYALASEIFVPPALKLAKNYRPLFNPSLNWVLSKNSIPSRLNGWKETNIIYRQIQQA